MEYTKISFRVVSPLWDRLNDELNAMFISRDPFISNLLKMEIPHLRKELSNKKNSIAAKRFITKNLDAFSEQTNTPLKPVSIHLPKVLASEFRTLLKENNVPGNAIFNRILLLVRHGSAISKHFSIPNSLSEAENNLFFDTTTPSPLVRASEFILDPMGFLRNWIELNEEIEGGLYTSTIKGKGLLAFSVYLEDKYVPGTPKYVSHETETHELLNSL